MRSTSPLRPAVRGAGRRRPVATLAAGLTLALAGAAVPPASGAAQPSTATGAATATRATSYDAGLSTPRRDSYYPGFGDPGVDVLHYGLRLDWKRGRRLLVGVADLRLRATADAASFRLDLGRSMTVGRVLVNGTPVAFEHPGRVLRVLTPVTAERRYAVRVTYRGTPRPVPAPTTRDDMPGVGMQVTRDGRLHTMQEPYGALTWYPVNDHPSDKALYDVTVSVPAGWVGVSNGRLVRRTDGPRRTTTTWHLAHPAASYLTTLAVGPYVHRRDTGPHGLPLHFWLPRGEAGRYLPALRHVGRDLRWLERRLGPYPFESAGVVIVPGGSAMETQTLVTFGVRSWGGTAAGRETMVHELAHQWYGDTVTPDDWRDLWMNEGMAMYLEAQWASQVAGDPWWSWTNWFRWSNVHDRADQGGPGAYHRGEFATDCVYTCTALMYDRLRARLGDDVFWRLVRRWPQSRLAGTANRQEFVDWVEARTGQELSAFFDDWLDSPTWPPA